MGEWTLYARNAALQRVGEIDDYQRLSLALRFNSVGAFDLEVPYGTEIASLLATDGAGIIAVKNGTVVASGPVRRRERKWGDEEDNLVVSGPDDNTYLHERLALPVVTGPPYTSAAYDVRSGVASTVMQQYVDYNAGASASAARRVPGLALAVDPMLGSTITGRARFQTLLELLQDLALTGGDLGFKIVQSGTALAFSVYDPEDKTATVKFSAGLGNLREFNYEHEAGTANYVVIGGGDELTARTFVERGDSDSISKWGRIEVFRDGRDTTDTTELGQRIDETLAEQAERTNIALVPVNTEGMEFITDYNLGDRVTSVVDGVAIEDVMRAVNVSLTPEQGEVVSPVVGTPGPQTVLALFAELKRMRRQISHLERR